MELNWNSMDNFPFGVVPIFNRTKTAMEAVLEQIATISIHLEQYQNMFGWARRNDAIVPSHAMLNTPPHAVDTHSQIRPSFTFRTQFLFPQMRTDLPLQ